MGNKIIKMLMTTAVVIVGLTAAVLVKAVGGLIIRLVLFLGRLILSMPGWAIVLFITALIAAIFWLRSRPSPPTDLTRQLPTLSASPAIKIRLRSRRQVFAIRIWPPSRK